MENKIDIRCNCNIENFCIHKVFRELVYYFNKYDKINKHITSELIHTYYQVYEKIRTNLIICRAMFPNIIFHDMDFTRRTY